MNYKTFIRLFVCLVFVTLGCSKDEQATNDLSLNDQAFELSKAGGATQISGIGYYAINPECTPAEPNTSYTVRLEGDLVGCLFVFVDEFDCSPSGTYRESGREHFIGTYKGETGEFWTTFKFEAKFEGCAANGSPLGAEIFGRCQHPIVKGSGLGALKGVTGRLDFKDDVDAGNFPYRGHLQF
jgi:hypothetical protein